MIGLEKNEMVERQVHSQPATCFWPLVYLGSKILFWSLNGLDSRALAQMIDVCTLRLFIELAKYGTNRTPKS